MKSTIIKILGIAGTFVFMTLWLSNCHNLTGKLDDAVAERDQAVRDYDSCKAAKVYVDIDTTVTDHIIEYVDRPVPYEVLRIDTVVVDRVEYLYPVQKYSDTLRTADFDLFWRAEGVLDKIEFPYYRLYDKTVTESHVIEKVRTEYVYKPESALYFYFGVNAMFNPGLSGVSGGFTYINKRGWGLGAGYLLIEKKSAFEAKVYLKIL